MAEDKKRAQNHPGDIEIADEPGGPRPAKTRGRMDFATPEQRRRRRLTRLAIAAVLFFILAMYVGASMWLATLGPLTGGPMVLPGIAALG